MRFLRGLFGALAAALLALIFAAVVTARPGDPALFPAADEAVPIVVVSHGIHSGLAIPRADLARIASQQGHGALLSLVQRFGAYDLIEIGWGEARFYRSTRTVEDLDWVLALRALFEPGNRSVLHVVGLSRPAPETFPTADMVEIKLSPAGFERLIAAVEGGFVRSLDGPPTELGPGLYGPSLFYAANGSFSLLNVCNHWTARMLDAAGVPTAPVPAVLPVGLLWDLRWRSGLRALPKRQDFRRGEG